MMDQGNSTGSPTAEKVTPAPEDAAHNFLLMFVQYWGQSNEKRTAAFNDFVRAAGRDPNSHETTAWIGSVLSNLERGKFEHEVEQLTAAIKTSLGAVQ